MKEIPHGAKLLVGGQLNVMIFHIHEVSITQWLSVGKMANLIDYVKEYMP